MAQDGIRKSENTVPSNSKEKTASNSNEKVTAASTSKKMTASNSNEKATAASTSKKMTASNSNEKVTAASTSKKVTAASNSNKMTAASNSNEKDTKQGSAVDRQSEQKDTTQSNSKKDTQSSKNDIAQDNKKTASTPSNKAITSQSNKAITTQSNKKANTSTPSNKKAITTLSNKKANTSTSSNKKAITTRKNKKAITATERNKKKISNEKKVDVEKYFRDNDGLAWYEFGKCGGGGVVDWSVNEKLMRGKVLLEEQVGVYEKEKKGKVSSDDKYLNTMMKSGTLADKIAAMTLTIQQSPLYNLTRIGQLTNMAKKKARRESQMALESLKDLFVNNLLPDRKLDYFKNQKCDGEESELMYVMWYLEHCIKKAFAELMQTLEIGLRDAVSNYKRCCMKVAYELLVAKPEQENVLLAMLVNKLGDPDRQIASKAMVLLQQVLDEHPVMKNVVVLDVERLLSRTNASDRTKYNAVLFLNQLYLSHGEEDQKLAAHLIKVYFSLFSKTVERSKGTKSVGGMQSGMDKKVLSSLLTGVNRAFPYVETGSVDFNENLKNMFRVVHQSQWSTSVQALMLIFQVMNSTDSVSDRFYTALYAKLFDPKLKETSKYKLFLNLVYKALKNDVSSKRTMAIIKRLLQISTQMPPTFVCSVLFLVSEVMHCKPTLRMLFQTPDVIEVPQNAPLPNDAVDEVHDQESNQDILEDAKDILEIAQEASRAQDVLDQVLGGQTDNNVAVISKKEDSSCDALKYDATKRNPLFANANVTCAWEMSYFVRHYHPSVQHFARTLLQDRISYAGDPLADFTLSAFLEKYLNKKAKLKDAPHRNMHSGGVKSALNSMPLNDPRFVKQQEADVQGDDLFFYKYFKERALRAPTTLKQKDLQNEATENDEEEMEKYAQKLAEDLMEDDFEDDDDVDQDDDNDLDEVSAVEVPENEGTTFDDDVIEGDDSDDEGLDAAFAEDLDDETDSEDEESKHSSSHKAPSKSVKPASKRKSPFVLAEDFDESDFLQQKQEKKSKKSRTD